MSPFTRVVVASPIPLVSRGGAAVGPTDEIHDAYWRLRFSSARLVMQLSISMMPVYGPELHRSALDPLTSASRAVERWVKDGDPQGQSCDGYVDSICKKCWRQGFLVFDRFKAGGTPLFT